MSTPDLDGGGLPLPYHRPPPHETTEAECQQIGGEWVPVPQAAVGGICRTEPPQPPIVIHLGGILDAGADAGDAGR